MTPTPADRKREQRERGRQWFQEHGYNMTTAEALLTAMMKLDANKIETLRRWVEQANKKG